MEWEWLWLALLGFGSGAYGVLVGAGGGFILGPVLLIFFDMEPQVVAGTALALVAVNSIAGSQAYRRMGLIDYRSGLLFAAVAIPGSVLAPFVLTTVAGGVFRLLFGLLLVTLAFQMLVHPHFSARSTPRKIGMFSRTVRSREITTSWGQVFRYEFNEFFATSFNFILGFISSFFGTGGGFLRTPILVAAFGFPVRVAAASSIFALSFYATAGAVTHASLGHVEWFPTFVWAGVGLVMGGQFGAQLSLRVKGPWILRLLMIVVLSLGIKLIMEAL